MGFRKAFGLASLASFVLLASACSGGAGSPVPTGEATGELSAHGGQVCPDRLPEPPEGADDSWVLAKAVPTVSAFESAWLCQYAAEASPDVTPSGGVALSWVRQGEPVEFPESGLGSVETMLSSLGMYPDDVVCTDDLGPRWMVVLLTGDDLTGVVVDDFGCRKTRLTDDPFVIAPGHSRDSSLVQGVLAPPQGIVADLKAAAGVQ